MRRKRRLAGALGLHNSVLLEEVLSYIDPKPGQIVLDGTVGSGGHAEAILRRIEPGGCLIGLDQDEKALHRSTRRLQKIGGRFSLMKMNFRYLDEALLRLHFDRIHAVLLDVGVSSEQLESAER